MDLQAAFRRFFISTTSPLLLIGRPRWGRRFGVFYISLSTDLLPDPASKPGDAAARDRWGVYYLLIMNKSQRNHERFMNNDAIFARNCKNSPLVHISSGFVHRYFIKKLSSGRAFRLFRNLIGKFYFAGFYAIYSVQRKRINSGTSFSQSASQCPPPTWQRMRTAAP